MRSRCSCTLFSKNHPSNMLPTIHRLYENHRLHLTVKAIKAWRSYLLLSSKCMFVNLTRRSRGQHRYKSQRLRWERNRALLAKCIQCWKILQVQAAAGRQHTLSNDSDHCATLATACVRLSQPRRTRPPLRTSKLRRSRMLR